jgi:prepilin-type N-terminal cleavage/methylation domain-containing protein
MPKRCRQAGFTLVELSIVLVIIGLILGGVMVGREMIRGAQVNRIVSDLTAYDAAVVTFQDKYNALPGDITNATQFWSGTTNGNGNGQIAIGSVPSAPSDSYRAWQHLALSQLIKGSFSGSAGPNSVSYHGQDSVIGVNVPKASISTAGFTFQYLASASAYGDRFDGSYGNYLQVGGDAGWHTEVGFLTPAEAYKIEEKLGDDGLPGTGNVRSMKATHTQTLNCATTDVTTTAQYNLTGNNRTCNLIYILGP